MARRPASHRRTVLRRRAVALLLAGAALVGGIAAAQQSGGGASAATEPGTDRTAGVPSTGAATQPVTTTAATAPTTAPTGRPVSIAWVGDMVLGSSFGHAPRRRARVPGRRRRHPQARRPHLRQPRGDDVDDVGLQVRRGVVQLLRLPGAAVVLGAAAKCGLRRHEHGEQPRVRLRADRSRADDRRAHARAARLHGRPGPDHGARGQWHTRGLPRLRALSVGCAPRQDPPGRRTRAKAAAKADLVVVAIHAGAEGSTATHVPHGTEYFLGENRGNSRAFAHAVINAGADLVVGSGPHVLRGVEQYHGHLIAYSLGNFAGFKNFTLGGTLSLSGILRVVLNPDGSWRSARLIPVAPARRRACRRSTRRTRACGSWRSSPARISVRTRPASRRTASWRSNNGLVGSA